ncbi:AAA family ATPase [Hymenobacter negativus]|uniref:ATP-binding protein n=1 Tax=Hymenobacter negativus TaxID=2795026 RepID=A0ABS3QAP2_9BACT|nr:AAA family ATPase [Hymenobacter negativus]MBO2008181.1 ATP-binding protein [Hymenobacter negativus]
MQAILFCGIQASGKSTFYCQRLLNSHVRISLDLLRTRHREALLLKFCLDTQAKFVVDNTNPTMAERQRYIGPAKAAGYAVVGYYFSSSASEALLRNQQRSPAEQVPAVGIRGTRARLEMLSFAEGFDELYFVRIADDDRFVVEPWQL